MTCSGCSGAVERALKNVKGIHNRLSFIDPECMQLLIVHHIGVSNIDISLETQLVKVTVSDPSINTQESIFEVIEKTGKPVQIIQA